MMRAIRVSIIFMVSLLSGTLAWADGGLEDRPAEGEPWQNPSMGDNPWNNIHNDSWFTDSYQAPGPEQIRRAKIDIIAGFNDFEDPVTGEKISIRLGGCPAHTYDTDGNLLTVCSGFPDPAIQAFKRSIVAISPEGKLLAYAGFEDPYEGLEEAIREFGGIGYFYQDNQERIVLAMPDGHVITWAREASDLSPVDNWVAVRDVNVTGRGGAVPSLLGTLYGLVPDEDGYVWFTTEEGVVGTIAPEPCVTDCVKWIDVNDPDGDGIRNPQPDGRFQRISESHSMDRKSTFQQTDYKMYRFDFGADGTPVIAWEMRYRRGNRIKPGQTSQGSGTSPSFFMLDGREFVTIMDNAKLTNINVYRAEKELWPGERRLFAQARPFGNDPRTANENSLVVYPSAHSGRVNIYGENNWGNRFVFSTAGRLVTRPGYSGIQIDRDGLVRVLPNNRHIRVPSVVSKGNVASRQLYTYNKRVSGWYLTAMNPRDPRRVLWAVQVGTGMPRYNNWYSQLSLAPDGDTFVIGTTVGVIRVRPTAGDRLPRICFPLLEPADFADTMGDLADYTGGPIFYPEYLKAAFLSWETDSLGLLNSGQFPEGQIRSLIADVTFADSILRRKNYEPWSLSNDARGKLGIIAASHDALLAEAAQLYDQDCATK